MNKTGALPTFRTPGFGHTKPKSRITSESDTSTSRDIIDLSFDCPSPPFKRRSEPPERASPVKRRKSSPSCDKENVTLGSISTSGPLKGKGKTKAVAPGELDKAKESNDNVRKRHQYNPFEQLDVDFPKFKRDPDQDHKDLKLVRESTITPFITGSAIMHTEKRHSPSGPPRIRSFSADYQQRINRGSPKVSGLQD